MLGKIANTNWIMMAGKDITTDSISDCCGCFHFLFAIISSFEIHLFSISASQVWPLGGDSRSTDAVIGTVWTSRNLPFSKSNQRRSYVPSPGSNMIVDLLETAIAVKIHPGVVHNDLRRLAQFAAKLLQCRNDDRKCIVS